MEFVERQDVAEDIVQDLFISLWERPITFKSYAGFKTFLYQSVRNASFNHLKHTKVKDKYLATLPEDDGSHGDELDHKIVEEELHRLLFQTIEKLPARSREIFKLHLTGASNETIAHTLGLSIHTVKTQKKRAVHFIKEELGGLYLLALAFFFA